MATGSALAAGGLVAGGLTSLIGGSMNMKAAYAEAGALRGDGDASYYDSLMEAYQVETEAAHFKENQTMKYVMSGVSLQGTPMQVLDYTSKQSQMEIDHIRERGLRQRQLAYIQASNMEKGARAQMFSTVAKTTLKVAGAFTEASNGGAFDSENKAGKGIGDAKEYIKTHWRHFNLTHTGIRRGSTRSSSEYGYFGNSTGWS